MKILMVNKFLYPNGGSETYIFKLGDYLISQGHEVQYFGMEHEGRCVGNRVDAYTSDMDFHGGSKLVKLTYPIKTIYSFEARKQIRKVLEDFKPDIVHLNNFNYQLTPSIIIEIVKWRKEFGRLCRIVYTAHDGQLVCPDHLFRNPNTNELCEKCLGGNYLNCFKGKCIHGSAAKSVVGCLEGYYWKWRKTYKYIDAVICPSDFLKSKLDTNKDLKERTVTLRNFIDKIKWKDVEKKDYVLYFGRYSEEKGINTLIETVRMLPDISFIFAGSGPLEDKVNVLSNVKNVGFKTGEDLDTLIREARFSLCPSEVHENCPFSVMESQERGTPVVGVRLGGVPELIEDKLNGRLFERKDSKTLAKIIKELWYHPETVEQYRNECKKLNRDGMEQYYRKLMKIYRGRNNVMDKGEIKMSKKSSGDKKLNGTVIVTYRCNARCSMCNRYKAPSKPEEELSIDTIKKLPRMYFTNITGGEPFIRTDLPDIVRELYKKSDRIVISTNGFFTDRIVALAKEFPQIGIRISIEGLEKTNNEIRGLENGYQRGYQTLKKLREMGMKDVGFGMTVQDKNAPDLVPLYDISDKMGMEFATASLHNSFYFVEAKNIIHNRPMVAKNFEKLINKLLKSNSPKKWFRAYFNHGLINYIYGQPRLLPCDMSFDTFFIDPYGDVMPCNGTKDKEVMGNLNKQTWDELWNSPEAEKVRKKVRHCDRQCWMIGSVSPAMHKYIWKPALWVAKHKFKALFSKKPYSMYENKICRDYHDGKVTKEQLDKCSTCDMCAIVNNGLSEASKAQLIGMTGEEIVDADIAKQMKGNS